MVIRLNQWGSLLVTRFLGQKIRSTVEAALRTSDVITLDFSGVEMASHSFIDELIGKLSSAMGIESLQMRIKLSQVTPETAAIIRFAVHDRLKQKETLV